MLTNMTHEARIIKSNDSLGIFFKYSSMFQTIGTDVRLEPE